MLFKTCFRLNFAFVVVDALCYFSTGSMYALWGMVLAGLMVLFCDYHMDKPTI